MEEDRKQEILEKLEKASSEEYVTQWDKEGKILKQTKKSDIEKGKKSRKSGADFELKVRKDLELKGWVVSKWQNNVDLEIRKIIPAKRKFNPFSKVMTIGTGFPDFFAFKHLGNKMFDVIGVESKLNGTLSKEEKEKCAFLLNQNIFNDIWISSKEEKNIKYESFREKFGEKFSLKKE
jgi:hypothetical protein